MIMYADVILILQTWIYRLNEQERVRKLIFMTTWKKELVFNPFFFSTFFYGILLCLCDDAIKHSQPERLIRVVGSY